MCSYHEEYPYCIVDKECCCQEKTGRSNDFVDPSALRYIEVMKALVPSRRGEWWAVYHGKDSFYRKNRKYKSPPGFGFDFIWRSLKLERRADGSLTPHSLAIFHSSLSFFLPYCYWNWTMTRASEAFRNLGAAVAVYIILFLGLIPLPDVIQNKLVIVVSINAPGELSSSIIDLLYFEYIKSSPGGVLWRLDVIA